MIVPVVLITRFVVPLLFVRTPELMEDPAFLRVVGAQVLSWRMIFVLPLLVILLDKEEEVVLLESPLIVILVIPPLVVISPVIVLRPAFVAMIVFTLFPYPAFVTSMDLTLIVSAPTLWMVVFALPPP